MTKFLDPQNDIAFRRVFGTDHNKPILTAMLNSVLSSQLRAPISEVTFLPTIQLPDVAAQKESIVDVICRDALGKQWIVEMQVAVTRGFEKRAQYYAYKAFVSQMGKGDAYQDLQEVIFLAFVNFDIFPHKLHYKSEHVTLDKKSGDHDLDRISFTFVDLKKFEQQRSKHVSQLTLEEKFYYYLLHAPTATEAELEQLIGEDPILRKAWEELNAYYWNEEELLMYERAERNRRDFEAMIGAAEDKGRGELEQEKGKAEQVGIEKGKQIGIEEGKQEAQVEMVRKLHAKGKSVQEIAELTDLPESEVRRILESPK